VIAGAAMNESAMDKPRNKVARVVFMLGSLLKLLIF
jgi:hypothetical protein